MANPDTSIAPSHIELGITARGVVIIPGSRMRGRWEPLRAGSVRVEWGDASWWIWLFGNVRDERFTGRGHVFTRFGASALVSYEGARVACNPRA
jgi:hypothetical protein